MTNKEKFIKTYTESFQYCYPDLPKDRSDSLIEKVLNTALKKIEIVNIDGNAFKETCKRLNIEHSYKGIRTFICG